MTQLALSLDGENPYWTACRRALGREPRAHEFIAWIQARWAEVAAALKCHQWDVHRVLGPERAKAAMLAHLGTPPAQPPSHDTNRAD